MKVITHFISYPSLNVTSIDCFLDVTLLILDFCGVCGTQHLNPDVLDTYPYCERCQSPLRSPAHLRKRFEHLEPRQYLEILFASYGDQITEKGAVDITHRVQVEQLPYTHA